MYHVVLSSTLVTTSKIFEHINDEVPVLKDHFLSITRYIEASYNKI